MNTLRKFFAALILLNFAFCFCAPETALAQTGTLGNEDPYLYCSYYDANGDAVDGNALTTGNYRVDIVISGMETAAVMQITAEVEASSQSALQSLSVTSTYDEDDDSFDLAAADFITDELLSVVLVSKNTESCSAIDSDGTVMASLSANIECNGTIDFNDYFNFVTDPDLTFFEADYGDGDDCYALSQGEGLNYTVYPMTADVTPAFNNGTIIISGTVQIAESTVGSSSHGFVIGGVDIVDSSGVVLGTSASDGTFSIEVDKGTTSLRFTGASTIDRTVYLTGQNDVLNAQIPVVICDYNKDTSINGTDLGLFKQKLSTSNAPAYYDLTNDGSVNGTDLGLFIIFMNKSINYPELHLDN